MLIGAIYLPTSDFYVDAATGSDANPGTQALPWLTLSHAQTQVRTLTPGQYQDITVHCSGTFAVSSALALTSLDGGQHGKKVTWTGGTLRGGVQVTGWSLWDAGKNIYRTAYSGVNPRAIWVDGVRAYRNKKASDSGFLSGASSTGTGYSSTGGFLNGTRNLANVELIYSAAPDHVLQFTQPRNKVVSATSTTITMQLNAHTWNNTFMAAYAILPNFVENLWENFYADATVGTFYYDEEDSFLYYCPRPADGTMTTAVVLAPVLDGSFITITGASNIDIDGITCEVSNWSMPYAFAESAQNQINTSTNANHFLGREFPPAAVQISGSTSCNLRNSTLRRLSTVGAHVTLHSVSCEVTRNTITDTAGNGIVLGENSEGPLSVCCDDVLIKNNTISYVGREFQGAVGIVAPFMANCEISHNSISYVPYSGMTIGLGLNMYDSWAAKVGNNSVHANRINNVLQVRGDGAGIYVQAPQNGLTLSDNYITNVIGSGTTHVGAIYLDMGTAAVSLTNNITVNSLYWSFFNLINESLGVIEFGTNYADTSSHLTDPGDPAEYVAPNVSADPAAAAPAIAAAAGVEP